MMIFVTRKKNDVLLACYKTEDTLGDNINIKMKIQCLLFFLRFTSQNLFISFNNVTSLK